MKVLPGSVSRPDGEGLSTLPALVVLPASSGFCFRTFEPSSANSWDFCCMMPETVFTAESMIAIT
ncbi:hypothetical protein C5E45_33030 [Nocardia nova]|uniref:Uncharacterized protein n=1 Tax=Nocardia nova TaxID=37330 RepID=A0A2S6ACJ8_9NOCA|nr:hypothetical protein C5E41_30770 [Nocardia nova]PPJ31818.1 hypothetical protein C5E45_33030 [Nocardia nova]